MTTDPKIMFEASILTDKAFWAKAVGGVALVATAFGLHPSWLSLESQAEIAGGVAMLAALAFQLWGDQGPVGLTAPVSSPDPVSLPAGVHTVTVAPPAVPVPPPPLATVVTQQPVVVPEVQKMPSPSPILVPQPPPASQVGG